ncbi:efflux RND transporter periplasmic adaptor subunit [Azospirillum halopraeferens]|uniref:efflux RND transporter periplasmic adaptor subunit n=1 Tax=Azospirillum halopraeferens TaxID=34010 RepID=UPI0004155FCA|nr:efflux RND transporter periplasmic adaptor subunit [Azospirillum halopraeferens]
MDGATDHTAAHRRRMPVAALLLLLVPIACGPAPDTAGDAAPQPRPVRVATVQDDAAPEVRRFVGRVTTVQTVGLSFRVPGRLVELPVQEGQEVPRGGVIAALDPAPFERAVREAQVRLTAARQEFERRSTLRERGIASEQALEQAQTDLDLAAVALENARQDLEHTRLPAPFDAIIARRLVANHTDVQAGQEVVRAQDVTEVRVVADVPEALLATFRAQDVLSLEAEFPFPERRRYPLAYREHATEPNAVTQTYRITFGMPRPEAGVILPGMSATVVAVLDRWRGNGAAASVSVPPTALGTDPDGRFIVWVLDEDAGTVRARPVTVGTARADRVPVLSGLAPGERIVTAGVPYLQDGMPVRPLDGVPVASE